jgi:hypothetical protein
MTEIDRRSERKEPLASSAGIAGVTGLPLGHLKRGPRRPPRAIAADAPSTRPVPVGSPVPDVRLLELDQTARYLGVSPWTVRDLEASGVLRRVSIPLGNGRELRKLLFDRKDLDRLIEAWKDGPLPA